MQDQLGRIEGDIQVIKQAIGLDRPVPPDSPVPHLLLGGSGVGVILLAWALEVMGSSGFPLVAALILGVPPLVAMIIWGRIKARNPALAPAAKTLARARREFWWQMLATAGLVGIMVACGLSLISAPVLLVLMAVLGFSLLNPPIVERRGYSGIGWFIAIGVLGVWMLYSLPVPGPRGAVLGLVLILGGGLAAGIAVLAGKWSKP